MDYRGVLLVGAVLGAGALASSSVACSGPDPGAITFAERQGQSTEPTPGGTSGTSGTSGTPTTDGGGADGAVADPIFGTTVMKWEDPGVAANAANAAHNNTVEGKDCVVAGCHLGGGKPWAFAGTVYSAAQGGAIVPKAEVRVVDANGTEVGHAYTDANGNFWLEKAGGIPANAKVGVRKEGGAPRAMATPLQTTDSGCSANRANCHGTAVTGKVYAP